MSKVKREHYVARSYLRGFTGDGNRLCAFDKLTKKHIIDISVDEVANEKYFYDQDGSQVIENRLANLDGIFPSWRDNFIQAIDKGKIISVEQQVKLAFYISMQLRRTRWFRNLDIEITKQLEDAFVTMEEHSVERIGGKLKIAAP